MEIPIENCVSAKVYKPDPVKKVFLLSLLALAYAIVLPYAYITAGEPRQAAILRAQVLEDEKWNEELSQQSQPESLLFENETSSSVGTVTSSTLFGKKIESDLTDEEFESLPFQFETIEKPSPSRGWFSSWFITEEQKEIKRKAKEHTERLHKKLKAAAGGDDLILPPWYLPSAWACLALFSTLTLHALFYLLCHWLVQFKAAVLFASIKGSLKSEDYVLVVPPANRGKAAFVEVQKSAVSGELKIEFQRQWYIYTSPERLGAAARDYPTGVLSLASSPINLPLKTYAASKGLRSEIEVSRAVETWGTNHLSLPTPSFVELLRQQLLSPLAIFQVFCALLWLLDEYWTYTLWTLCSVVIFEAMTVFQRTKTLNMLGGMAPKPISVFAFRCGRWNLLTSKELLPGDIISISYKCKAPEAASSIQVSAAVQAGGALPPGASDVVPCDCLLLSGSAVVNEASLTGESVPQMKEAVPPLGDMNASSSSPSSESSDGEEISSAASPSTQRLDINGAHRVHTLFSGTTLVTVDNGGHGSEAFQTTASGIPAAPDGGAIAYVLRTGFSSSQGALMQMIEFSTQTVSGDSKETGLALFMLLIFALIASAYVLKEGLRKKEKTTHEILLKCVIIITSVVPRQLPMQMAMAVNMALMALMKSGIFCTEPFRVPLAGKISHCLFDKTGTLTTDQLVPIGVVNVNVNVNQTLTLTPEHSNSVRGREAKKGGLNQLSPVRDASDEAAMCLAACHSLVVVDTTKPAVSSDEAEGEVQATTAKSFQVVGDPIELAALKGVEWTWDAETSTATPGSFAAIEAAVRILREKYVAARTEESRQPPQQPASATPAFSGVSAQQQLVEKPSEVINRQLEELQTRLEQARERAARTKFSSVQVLQRHYFSSSLQRMSVVSKVSVREKSAAASTGKSSNAGKYYCFVKGSPEAIRTLLVPGSAPEWYDSLYKELARKGLRILALAYKTCSVGALSSSSSSSSSRTEDLPENRPREWVESELTFCGFIAFECKIRADSPTVIGALRESGHSVAMLTGDSPLTSVHVAKEVNICSRGRPVLILSSGSPIVSSSSAAAAFRGSSTGPLETDPHWLLRHNDGSEELLPFVPIPASGQRTPLDSTGAIDKLAERYDLITTEADFLAVCDLLSSPSHLRVSEKDGSLSYNRTITSSSSSSSLEPEPLPSSLSALTEGNLDLDASLGLIDSSKPNLSVSSSVRTSASSSSSLPTSYRSLWHDVGLFKVFSRMSPQGKRYVIAALQKLGKRVDSHVLMCGDGGNDVGALKQADVGIALLAGHANANTTQRLDSSVNGEGEVEGEKSDSSDAVGSPNPADAAGGSAEDALNAHDKELQSRIVAVNKAREAHMKVFQAKFMKDQQEIMQRKLRELTEKGEWSGMFGLMKSQASETKAAMDAENKRFMAMHGHVWDPKKHGGGEASAGGMEDIMSMLGDSGGASGDPMASAGGGPPVVRPGDASVAAPFTSRVPSVRAVVDLIRQGRCTLLSALMQQQIMMLESTISAYTLSALSLHNARSSERQMMASSWLIMTAAVAFSYSSPVDKMHPQRPLNSLFHPAIILSILGQAAIHIACMTLAVHWSTEAMGPELLKEVTEFFKKAKAKQIDAASLCDEDDIMCSFTQMWQAPFMPNLLNTVVFLVETSQMISVFFANYKGRPWMKGMLENHPLFLSVFICIAGVVVASWEMVPQLNELIQLAPFPDDYFRYKVVALVCATIAGTFLWDRLCTLIFAPKVFKAMMDEAKKTTFLDVLPVLQTAGKVIAVVLLLGTGNIILIGMAIYYYRNWSIRNAAVNTPPSGTPK